MYVQNAGDNKLFFIKCPDEKEVRGVSCEHKALFSLLTSTQKCVFVQINVWINNFGRKSLFYSGIYLSRLYNYVNTVVPSDACINYMVNVLESKIRTTVLYY